MAEVEDVDKVAEADVVAMVEAVVDAKNLL